MNLRRMLNSYAIAAAGLLCLAQAAHAENFFDKLNGILNGYPSGSNLGSNQYTTISNLNSFRADIDARISSAQASGQISSAQAAQFRAQLNDNASAQSQLMADGSLSFGEARNLNTFLSNVDSSLHSAISANVVVNPGFGFGSRSGFGMGRGSMRVLVQQEQRIANRLDIGRRDGRLTAGEYSMLKADLNRVTNRRQMLMSSQGRLTMAQRERLSNRLKQLNNDVTLQIRDSEIAGRWNRMY